MKLYFFLFIKTKMHAFLFLLWPNRELATPPREQPTASCLFCSLSPSAHGSAPRSAAAPSVEGSRRPLTVTHRDSYQARTPPPGHRRTAPPQPSPTRNALLCARVKTDCAQMQQQRSPLHTGNCIQAGAWSAHGRAVDCGAFSDDFMQYFISLRWGLNCFCFTFFRRKRLLLWADVLFSSWFCHCFLITMKKKTDTMH